MQGGLFFTVPHNWYALYFWALNLLSRTMISNVPQTTPDRGGSGRRMGDWLCHDEGEQDDANNFTFFTAFFGSDVNDVG